MCISQTLGLYISSYFSFYSSLARREVDGRSCSRIKATIVRLVKRKDERDEEVEGSQNLLKSTFWTTDVSRGGLFEESSRREEGW